MSTNNLTTIQMNNNRSPENDNAPNNNVSNSNSSDIAPQNSRIERFDSKTSDSKLVDSKITTPNNISPRSQDVEIDNSAIHNSPRKSQNIRQRIDSKTNYFELPDQVKQLIIDEGYVVDKYLGKSQLAYTYIIVDNFTGKKYYAKYLNYDAIKLKLPDSSGAKQYVFSEIELLKKLSLSDNFIQFRQLIQNDNDIVLVMDYFHSGNIGKYIDNKMFVISELKILKLLDQFLDISYILSKNNYQYSAICPKNIFISDENLLKVCIGDLCFGDISSNSLEGGEYNIYKRYGSIRKDDIWSILMIVYQLYFHEIIPENSRNIDEIKDIFNNKFSETGKYNHLKEICFKLLEVETIVPNILLKQTKLIISDKIINLESQITDNSIQNAGELSLAQLQRQLEESERRFNELNEEYTKKDSEKEQLISQYLKRIQELENPGLLKKNEKVETKKREEPQPKPSDQKNESQLPPLATQQTQPPPTPIESQEKQTEEKTEIVEQGVDHNIPKNIDNNNYDYFMKCIHHSEFKDIISDKRIHDLLMALIKNEANHFDINLYVINNKPIDFYTHLSTLLALTTNLTFIDIIGCRIGEDRFKAFISCFKSLPNIDHLLLGCNELTDKSVVELSGYLQYLQELLYLDMSYNKITYNGMTSFKDKIHFIKNLKFIRLEGNTIDHLSDVSQMFISVIPSVQFL